MINTGHLSETTIILIPADSPYIHSWTFNILHGGVRVSFCVFHFTFCQVPGDVPVDVPGGIPECSEMPSYSPQWQLLQKRHFALKGAVVERFDTGTKPFPVSGKPNLRSGGPSSQKNVTPDVRLRKTLSMKLPRIQSEIYEPWKTCRVPASCDFQPRILLSANKTWRQHNAWLAANELNYEAGVWRGRKRMNDWGARQREGRARTKGRNPCLPFFLARPYSLPPFTTRWNDCYTGYNSVVSTSKL